jgi:peptide/nickel transport system substrate-binding protein
VKLDILRVKQNLGRFMPSIVVVLFIYLIISGLVFFNFKKITAYDLKARTRTVVEGLIVPQANISTAEIFNVDPLLSSSSSESVIEIRKNISYLIFSSLFKENVTDGLTKDIIADYEFKNAKDLKIRIRDGVQWSDGVPLTSQDVIFTLNLIKAIGQNGFYYGAVNGGEVDYKALNDAEFTITLASDKGASPNVAYLHELTFPILPKHVLENYSQAQMTILSTTPYGLSPVGSGKFTYKANLGSEVILNRNDNYYDKKVTFDSYTYRFYKSYDDIVKDFTLKNVDVFTRKDMVAEDNLHRSMTSAGARAVPMVLRDRRYVLYFNLDSKDSANSPFLKSVSLRDGLLHVVNRENLLKSINNYGRAIYGPIDQSSWAFSPEVQNEQALNLEDFTKRVESQGYVKNGDFYEKNGSKLTLTLTYLNGETRNTISLALQKDLKNVGVDLKLKVIGSTVDGQENTSNIGKQSTSKIEIDQFNDIVNNRNFDALLTTVNHSQDPDVFTEWHSTKNAPPGLNLAGLNSKVVDISLVEGRIEPDREKRKTNYARFQRTFIQEVPAIYLLNPSVITYYSDRLQSKVVTEINDIPYKYDGIGEWEFK